jgi:hypothetical protein
MWMQCVLCELWSEYLSTVYVGTLRNMTSGFRRGVCLRSSLFLDSTQRRKAISYRRFGTSCLLHLQVSSGPRSLRMVPIRWPETPVTNYPSTLRTIPKHRGSAIYNSLRHVHFWHAPPPSRTNSPIRRRHGSVNPILETRHHHPAAHPCHDSSTQVLHQMEITAEHKQNRSHIFH